MEAFRKELLDKAAVFYGAFTREESSNVKLRAEAAWAHSRLGDVNRLLDRDDDAAREYKLGIASFEGLVREHPSEVEYRRGLAYCHNWLGETIRGRIAQSGEADGWRRAQAKAEYDAAIALQRPIHDAAPANPLYAQELARSYYNRGILSYGVGDLTATAADFGAAIRLLEPIGGATAAPGGAQLSPLPAQDLARVYNDLGTLLRHQGQNAQARDDYDKAIQLAERLSSADPQNREYRFELAQYYDNQAMVLVDLQQLPAAAERNRQAVELIDELASPSQAMSMAQLRAVKLRGEILLAQGSPEAQAESDRELELLEELQRRRPQHDRDFQIMYARLAGNYIELATRELQEGKTHEAQDAVQSLGRILPQLTTEDRAVAERSYEELRREVGAKL
jgi:tetratricopeptide (TPR) repeat protein